MGVIKQMRSVKSIVHTLLTNFPHLRDSDEKLISTFWWKQLGERDQRNMSAFNFLTLYSEGKLTSPESIRRMRQKLQETCPELRGKNYKTRQEIAKEVSNLMKKS